MRNSCVRSYTNGKFRGILIFLARREVVAYVIDLLIYAGLRKLIVLGRGNLLKKGGL